MARSPVPKEFAMRVPMGINLTRGLRWMDKVYLVSVPGNENRRAAVAWCRKEAGSRKYAG